MLGKTSKVYLIHMARKMSHAQHYIGWAVSLDKRIAHHYRGTGARMLAVAADRGIEFSVVRVWDDKDRTWERRLKRYKHAPKLCPVCSGNAAYNRMKGDEHEAHARGILPHLPRDT